MQVSNRNLSQSKNMFHSLLHALVISPPAKSKREVIIYGFSQITRYDISFITPKTNKPILMPLIIIIGISFTDVTV